MSRDRPAELLREDASRAMLTIMQNLRSQKGWITDVRDFPFVEHPGKERLDAAMTSLWHLGAIESVATSELTPRGQAMSRMDATPRVAAALLEADALGVTVPTAVVLGMMSSFRTLFRRGRTDEEKAAVKKGRKKLAEVFPHLGDVGVAVAVWLGQKDAGAARQKEWCAEHGISSFTLRASVRTAAANQARIKPHVDSRRRRR